MKNKLFLFVAFIFSAMLSAQNRAPVVVSASGPSVVLTAPSVQVTMPQVRVAQPQVVVVNPQTRVCNHYECRKVHYCTHHHDNGKHKGHYKHEHDWDDNQGNHHGPKKHGDHGHHD